MSQVDAMLPLAAAEPRGRRRPALATWVAGLASSLLGGIVLLHAALIPGGRWDGDEYFNFAMLREIGWGFAWRRLYQWSPRPVSEAALWLYDGAVTLAGAPLVAPFLALLWAALIGGGVLALWRPRAPGAPWRLAVALAVPAAMLLVRPINEMFYWPMAAAPYLLALAGIVVLTFRLVAGRTATRRDRTICALALLRCRRQRRDRAVLRAGLLFCFGRGRSGSPGRAAVLVPGAAAGLGGAVGCVAAVPRR